MYHVLQMRLNENMGLAIDLPRNALYFSKIEFLGLECVKVKASQTVADKINE